MFGHLLPWLLAGSAGAMVFVVGGEVIPESHRHGQEGTATAALVAGFTLYLLLELALPRGDRHSPSARRRQPV